jgi:hypothetical protein
MYNIDFDDTSSSSAAKSFNQKSSSSNNIKSNINIRIPDIISNATNKSNQYTRLNLDEDDSDYELDTRKLNDNKFNKPTSNQSQSIQLQHEV